MRFRTNRLDAVIGAVISAALAVEVAVLFCNAVGRSFFHYALVWSEEVAAIALVVVAFVGGVAAYRQGEHMTVRFVLERLPERVRTFLEAFGTWLNLCTGLILAWLTREMIGSAFSSRTPVLGLPHIILVLPLVVGMFLLAVYAFEALRSRPRGMVFTSGASLVIVATVIALTKPWWETWASGHALEVTLALFACLIAIGVPIGFVLAQVAMVFLSVQGATNLVAVPSDMLDGVSNSLLLCIPFFILAGLIMTEGGLSKPLADFVRQLVGRLPGGLLQVVVVTMYLFSGISGSKAADVAAVGTTMNPMLRREGYPETETAAVLAASAVMGETIPPSIGMLVLASVTSVSVAALFAGGLLPAAIIGIAVMLVVHIRAVRNKFPIGQAPTVSDLFGALLRALPTIVLPVFLIGGIIGGLATPTELSAFAVVYSLILVAFYRSLSFTSFVKLLRDTATAGGMILFIIGTAIALARALAIAQIPEQIVALLHNMTSSSVVFLIATVVLLIIMGAVLEGLPALLIFAPLLMPVATQLGINPVHYGLVLILAMGLGSFSPPIGVGLYITCAVCRVSMEQVSVAFASYFVVLVLGVVGVALFPEISLIVPRALNLVR